jgi:hypothetical protein
LNAGVKRIAAFLAVIFLGACAGPPETLAVKQFTLRDDQRETAEDPMIRMEKARRLHGAISMAERRQRLGQYFTLVWHDPDGAGFGPVEVLFEYQQGGTASRVKRMSKVFPASDVGGAVDFAVIGDDYLTGGRVLAWRASVSRGGRELASRQSYLWR